MRFSANTYIFRENRVTAISPGIIDYNLWPLPTPSFLWQKSVFSFTLMKFVPFFFNIRANYLDDYKKSVCRSLEWINLEFQKKNEIGNSKLVIKKCFTMPLSLSPWPLAFLWPSLLWWTLNSRFNPHECNHKSEQHEFKVVP